MQVSLAPALPLIALPTPLRPAPLALPQDTWHPSWGGRLATFASDAIDAGRLATAAGTAHWLGEVAYLGSLVWGPVMAGIGMAVGGIQIARSVTAPDPAERNRRLVTGGLDMAISAAALAATTGVSPVFGAAATTALVGVKLVYSVLRPTP